MVAEISCDNVKKMCQTIPERFSNTTTMRSQFSTKSLRWRHNERDGVSNHQPHDCLLNRLFRHRSKKTSELRVTGLCVGNSPVTGEFPAQMASAAENVSIWYCNHVHLTDKDAYFASRSGHCIKHKHPWVFVLTNVYHQSTPWLFLNTNIRCYICEIRRNNAK